jgi:hypothetical protein
MRAFAGRFLPDRFRPREPRRRSRRQVLLPILLGVAGLSLVPLWTVGTVEVTGADVVPGTVAESLAGLVGHSVVLLDLEWLRMVAATWPDAGDVRVRLELPGTLVVAIVPQPAAGSVRVGRGWHAVSADGRMAGAVAAPVPPVLGSLARPADRRRALQVARRLAEASGAGVDGVELVTPADLRVSLLIDDGREAVIHVTPDGTEAERVWCRAVRSGGGTAEWADLRWPHRMVVRGDGDDSPAVEVGS